MKKTKTTSSKTKMAERQKARPRVEILAPNLRKILVKPEKLILDPNNPRFMTREDDRVNEDDYLDLEIGGATLKKIYPDGKDMYKIEQLINSIKQNGWWPVDYIFVRKFGEDDRYVVLEGNRRIAAIREIKNDSNADPALKKSLEAIKVMEVIDPGSPAKLKRKITYLLGVRHHGSLVKWTAFAQAHNIYKRYLEVSDQTPESFAWNKGQGQAVADTLSITLDDVVDRLKVYRAMDQLGNVSEVKNGPGGMKGRYYSVCEEPLSRPGKKLGRYIIQDPQTFLLTDDSLVRMNTTCHFSVKDRNNAPIRNPQEWRYLDKILADPDESERTKNLREVEVDKRLPSDVWAERAAVLSPETWEKWLLQVNSILKTVSFGDDLDSPEAKNTARRLIALIDTLDKRDIQ